MCLPVSPYSNRHTSQVAEALLDLTGAPTEIIDFSESSFDPEVFWARLRAYSRLGLPMGCGTNSAVGEDQLREVCGDLPIAGRPASATRWLCKVAREATHS